LPGIPFISFKELFQYICSILTDIDTTKNAIDNIFIDIDVIPCFNGHVSEAKQCCTRKIGKEMAIRRGLRHRPIPIRGGRGARGPEEMETTSEETAQRIFRKRWHSSPMPSSSTGKQAPAIPAIPMWTGSNGGPVRSLAE
jgi:hypothetical protein